MQSVRFIYEEHTYGGGICEGQEDNDWPDYEDSWIEMHPQFLLRNDEPLKKWYSGCDAVEFVGDISVSNAWIVYVRYSTGDTFSHTEGETKAIKAFENRKDAENLVEEIKNGGDGGLGYKPWEGYFERFQSVEMRLLPLTD